MDNAMFNGLIDPTLPRAKKEGLQLLKASYATQDAAATEIPRALDEFYRQKYSGIYAARQKDVAEARPSDPGDLAAQYFSGNESDVGQTSLEYRPHRFARMFPLPRRFAREQGWEEGHAGL